MAARRLFFASGVARIPLAVIPIAFCEQEIESKSILEQADTALEADKFKIQTPMQFESLKQSFNAGKVHSFDGLRFAVSKQVNLNTAVSHFYWIGSQQTGGQIYQYRVILPFDDKVLNIASDPDGNVEGEAKLTLSPNMALKSNFVASNRENSMNVQLDASDRSSAIQLEYSLGANQTVGLSYMQSIYPNLSLGGLAKYNISKNAVRSAFAGAYDDGISSLTFLVDKQSQILYIRRVNPNRVHLSTDVVFNADGTQQMSLAAEYILKQSKLHMSIDSSLGVKSVLETTVLPGFTVQLCAEEHHAKDIYRFGLGVNMG